MNERFYQKTWFCVLMMFCCCFPIGIFLMWRYKKFNKTVRIIISTFFAMIVISAITQSSKEKEGDKEKNDNISMEQSTYEETTQETMAETVEETKTAEEEFYIALEPYMTKEIAEKLYSILKNDMGFEKISFSKKNAVGDSNFDISADEYKIMVSASDDVYRMICGDYVLYEEGKVVNTRQNLEDRKISSTDRTAYYIMAQEIIKNNLKSPKSADFPSIVFSSGDISMARNGDLVAVQSYVDAQNSFGAEIRSKWIVEFKIIDKSQYSYEVIYINIDGQSTGEYIELN